jgi:hypothetical protein
MNPRYYGRRENNRAGMRASFRPLTFPGCGRPGRWGTIWQANAAERACGTIRFAALARIIHRQIVTRSVSEGRAWSSPRLRFGLRFRML